MDFEPEAAHRFKLLVQNATGPLPPDTFTTTEEAKLFINWCLAGSYNKEGSDRWWDRPRSQLGGKTPNEVWPDKARTVNSVNAYIDRLELKHLFNPYHNRRYPR